MKTILIILMFFTFNKLLSQETVAMKEVYIVNNLAYKIGSDNLFTGIAQVKRSNGHLVYEEEFKNGVIIFSYLYFNGKEKRLSTKTIYNPNKPYVLSKEFMYDLKGDIFEIHSYNDEGIKILKEQFTNGNLSYSCQYLGKNKHGTEYCLHENGIETIKEFNNGKKVK